MLRKRSSSSSLSQDDPLPTRIPMNPPPTSPALAHSPNFPDSPSEAAAVQKKGQQHPEHEGISDWEAGVSLAKAIMGAGSFALPWAFSKMGYIAGPIVLVIFLGLSVRSIGLLVDCARWLRRQTAAAAGGGGLAPASSVSYVDVARATFGPTGAALAYAASIASSIGVCGSYLVFVAVNLSALLKGITKTEIGGDDEAMAIAERKLFLVLVWTVALPIAVLLSSVRNPKRFAEVSLWGDLSVVAGMLAVVVYGVAFDERQSQSSFRAGDCVAIGSPKDMALALGSIGYLFLVHFLVLPIESSMEGPKMGDETGTPDAEAACSSAAAASDPTDSAMSSNHHGVPTSDHSSRDRFQTVVTKTFVVCGSIGGIFGIIGYFLFGTNTQQIVLLNVEGSIGMAIVQSLLCIDLLLTYPVVMRPSIRILEEHWRLTELKKRNEKKNETHNERREDKMLQMVALVPSSRNASETSFTSSCSKRSAASAPTFISGAFGNLGDRENLANGVLPSGGDSNHNYEEEETSILGSCDHLVVCVALGVVAAGAGSFVPAFGLLSGLVGGVSQTFLAFVLPPLMWAKQQHQSELSACACFGSLPWSEKSLVLCGLGLIGWTLQSTWAELGNENH